MTSRCFGLQSIPESSDRGLSCQAHGWQRSPRKRCWAIWVENRDREPAPRWRSPCRVEPPQTKLSIAAHAKSDGSMQRSLQEITEVLQASTGLLGSCLSREALYAWACIYAIDKAEKLSPLLLAYKPRWSSLLPIHSALPIHLRSISQSNRSDSPPAPLQVVNDHICLPCWVLTSPSMSPVRHGRVSLLDCSRRSLVSSMGEWKAYNQMDSTQQCTDDGCTATTPRQFLVCKRWSTGKTPWAALDLTVWL